MSDDASHTISFKWISEAWALLSEQRGAWTGAMLIYFVLMIGVWLTFEAVTGDLSRLRQLFLPHHHSPKQAYGAALVVGSGMTLVGAVLDGGLYQMALRQARGNTIAVQDIFSAGNKAIPLVMVGLPLYLVTSLAYHYSKAPGWVLSVAINGLLMFAPLLIVDREQGPLQAIARSFALLKKQWLMAAFFCLIAGFAGCAGILLVGAGLVFTYPVTFVSITLSYLTLTGQRRRVLVDYRGTLPEQWPPAPRVPGA